MMELYLLTYDYPATQNSRNDDETPTKYKIEHYSDRAKKVLDCY